MKATSGGQDITQGQILATIQEILREVVGRKDITVTLATTAREVPGWDSLAHVSLILAVEKAFNIRLRAAEIAQLQDVGSLVALVVARVKA
ncbi:MAG: acyl carrier protein [Candidatus Methylomirabilis sp.]